MGNKKKTAGGGKQMNHNVPLTPEQQNLATQYHQTIFTFLNIRGLDDSDWYDVAVFGYLRAVRRYTICPELHRYSFKTIAYYAMDSAVYSERRKQNLRIRTLSLDTPITEDGLTILDVIGTPDFLPDRQEDNFVAAQYMPLLNVLTKKQLDVLTMKAEGYTNKEIASVLGYRSLSTVGSVAERGRAAIRKAEDNRSDELKARTDKELGYCTPLDLFKECETKARRKLALNSLKTDKEYSENNLALLVADIIRHYNMEVVTT